MTRRHDPAGDVLEAYLNELNVERDSLLASGRTSTATLAELSGRYTACITIIGRLREYYLAEMVRMSEDMGLYDFDGTGR